MDRRDGEVLLNKDAGKIMEGPCLDDIADLQVKTLRKSPDVCRLSPTSDGYVASSALVIWSFGLFWRKCNFFFYMAYLSLTALSH